jgi:hypothetical protein
VQRRTAMAPRLLLPLAPHAPAHHAEVYADDQSDERMHTKQLVGPHPTGREPRQHICSLERLLLQRSPYLSGSPKPAKLESAYILSKGILQNVAPGRAVTFHTWSASDPRALRQRNGTQLCLRPVTRQLGSLHCAEKVSYKTALCARFTGRRRGSSACRRSMHDVELRSCVFSPA